MSDPGFVHLQVHSEFSLADGIVRIKQLAERCKALGMPAIALTDRGNLFGLVKFYSACLSAGIKPIVGAELRYLTAAGATARTVLLAMNQEGYRNLLQLVSRSYTHGDTHGVVPRADVLALSDGLIALCGGRGGEVGQAVLGGHQSEAERLAAEWAGRYPGRYYLEVQRTGRADEESHLHAVVALAASANLPVVATNEVCFLEPDDFEAHETRVCIHSSRVLNDPRRPRNYSAEQYLKSAEEMAARFEDLPEALANSVEIARRCNVQIELGTYYLPNYPVPDDETLETHLERMSSEGLDRRLETTELTNLRNEEAYRERLAFELNVINQMGFPGYFLIVMEFIQWAKAHDIPVGPGRGSGAGSLVAYALGITDLDPLEYDLLFERFLNPERVSMPDFDVDFCMEGRDKVIQHVSETYGHDAVSQIITFGTMAAKAVVRDVARVQGKPYGLADRLSKLIPFEVGMTLSKAVEQSEELVEFIEQNDEVTEIMEMAYKLEGIVRNVGKHAGGVVIAPSELTDFVPLYCEEQGGGLVSQFDKDDVERAGLVKFDFLGLKTLTIIDWCVQSVNAVAEADAQVDIDRIDLADAQTFELLKSAETVAVFQLESRGMRDLIRRLLPDHIEDIIALVALFRPGPLQSGAVDDYINRKHGREPVSYPHPTLEESLIGTYGVVLYQEQVMQIAQVLAGFSLGQADLLRRAMGKKKPEEMAKVRKQFLEGTSNNDVDADLAGDIFDLMEKFAGYAFNKSHSATYALVSYQTAWLKRHHPTHFMAANMSADMHNVERVEQLVAELRHMGLTLLPPSINASAFRFSATDTEVVYGLGAVRGVGEGPVEALIQAREQGGAFSSLHDFCQRVDARKANKRVLEALVRSGAMDELGDAAVEDLNIKRAQLMHLIPDAMQRAEQASRDADLGMSDLFGGVAQAAPDVDVSHVRAWRDGERLAGEKDTLGLYLTGHPIDSCIDELRVMCRTPLQSLRPDKGSQSIAGIVTGLRTMKSRRGGTMAFIELDDKTARVEAAVFADVYEQHRSRIQKDAVLVLDGEVQVDEYNGGGAVKIRVTNVSTFAEARRKHAKNLEIDINGSPREQLSERLQAVLRPHRVSADGCGVALRYDGDGARALIRLGSDWQVLPDDELIFALKGEFGERNVRLAYRHETA